VDRSSRGTLGTCNIFPVCLSRTKANGSFESLLSDSYSDSKSSGIECCGRVGTTLALYSGGLRFKGRGNRLSQVQQGGRPAAHAITIRNASLSATLNREQSMSICCGSTNKVRVPQHTHVNPITSSDIIS